MIITVFPSPLFLVLSRDWMEKKKDPPERVLLFVPAVVALDHVRRPLPGTRVAKLNDHAKTKRALELSIIGFLRPMPWLWSVESACADVKLECPLRRDQPCERRGRFACAPMAGKRSHRLRVKRGRTYGDP